MGSGAHRAADNGNDGETQRAVETGGRAATHLLDDLFLGLWLGALARQDEVTKGQRPGKDSAGCCQPEDDSRVCAFGRVACMGASMKPSPASACVSRKQHGRTHLKQRHSRLAGQKVRDVLHDAVGGDKDVPAGWKHRHRHGTTTARQARHGTDGARGQCPHFHACMHARCLEEKSSSALASLQDRMHA